MPTISTFYGITIMMYPVGKEHNPPHIHVIYGEETFSIAIKDGSILDGELNPSSRTLSMVNEWMAMHKDELLQMWETQEFHEIEPLE